MLTLLVISVVLFVLSFLLATAVGIAIGLPAWGVVIGLIAIDYFVMKLINRKR